MMNRATSTWTYDKGNSGERRMCGPPSNDAGTRNGDLQHIPELVSGMPKTSKKKRWPGSKWAGYKIIPANTAPVSPVLILSGLKFHWW